MGGEENRRLAQRFFDEVMNGMDPTAAEEILAPEFATHHPNFPVARGPEGVLGMLNMLRSAIPDLKYAVQETIADDANVAVRWLALGTPSRRLHGHPPNWEPCQRERHRHLSRSCRAHRGRVGQLRYPRSNAAVRRYSPAGIVGPGQLTASAFN